MNEEGNNNLLAEVLGSLINNKNGDNMFGGNGMWAMFMFFILIWGGGFGNFGGFGNRGFFGPNPATQNDVVASTMWGQTQDAIRDSIENTTNTTGRLSQDIAASNANILNNINGLNNAVNQMNYNSLAQSNATNQQLARTGFDLQTAVMAGNNMLQGAIMGGNNMINSAIRETAGDTKLTFCQGNSALQAIIQGTGNNIQNAIYQTANDTQRAIQGTANATQRDIQNTANGTQMAIYQTSNDTQRAIQGTANGTQMAIYQTANATQRDIQSMNSDARLAICQSTNALQNTSNENANRTNATIAATSNSILQGITGLGFLTQQKGDELKFELAKSTCDITSNNTANTQKVLDKLCMMEAGMQAAKIQELQTANQALMLANQVKDLQASQLATAGYIINQVNPQARPAWIVSSPYQSVTTTTTGG